MTDIAEGTLAEEAQAILNGASGDEPLPGLDADTKVSILNTQFATSEKLDLGGRVEFRLVGYVKFVGDELLENEGKRHLVKVQTNLIELIPESGNGNGAVPSEPVTQD